MRWRPEQDRYFTPPAVEAIGPLEDGDLILILREAEPARPQEGWASSFYFEMIERASGAKAGGLRLRFAETEELVLYGGQIGYGVDEPFRGRRFAARSVRLLLPVARLAGMEELWVTCDPENIASRRSIERAGAKFVEIVDIAKTSPMYAKGRRRCCRYRFDLRKLAP
ncbi:MAG TPA: GNAT family N-acetyltransferase [Fimbriimonadaceae bacterium]|nr:GNAT family N-acetyltransferase [Fimbriimonadaceae bacterium]